MPTITIEITAPAGTDISVRPVVADQDSPSPVRELDADDGGSEIDEDSIREYLLSFMPFDGSPQPELYRASAERMLAQGIWTVDDLAEDLGEPVSSMHAHVRNASRTIQTWKDRKGTDPQVEWIAVGYAPNSRRRQFAYSPGVAEVILEALDSRNG